VVNEKKDISNWHGNRIYYLDYLRLFAAIAVIILHTVDTEFGSTKVTVFKWQYLNACDGLVRWCVPVFVMISGALFLERQIDIKKIYSKL